MSSNRGVVEPARVLATRPVNAQPSSMSGSVNGGTKESAGLGKRLRSRDVGSDEHDRYVEFALVL